MCARSRAVCAQYATIWGQPDLAATLLAHAADPRPADSRGETALQHAIGERQSRIVAMIEEALTNMEGASGTTPKDTGLPPAEGTASAAHAEPPPRVSQSGYDVSPMTTAQLDDAVAALQPASRAVVAHGATEPGGTGITTNGWPQDCTGGPWSRRVGAGRGGIAGGPHALVVGPWQRGQSRMATRLGTAGHVLA